MDIKTEKELFEVLHTIERSDCCSAELKEKAGKVFTKLLTEKLKSLLNNQLNK